MNGLSSNRPCQGLSARQHAQTKTLGSVVKQFENCSGFNEFEAIGISLNERSAFFFKRDVSGDYNLGSNFFSRIFATNEKYLSAKSTICFLNRINVVRESTYEVHFSRLHHSLSFSRTDHSTLCNFTSVRYELRDVAHAVAGMGGQA